MAKGEFNLERLLDAEITMPGMGDRHPAVGSPADAAV